MAQAKGSNTKIIVGLEGSYGTLATFDVVTAAKSALVIPYASFNVKNAANHITNNLIKGSRNPIKPARGNKSPGGTLSTLLTPHMYSLFAYLLGKRKVTDSYTNPIVVTNQVYVKGAAGQTIVNNVEGYTATGENAAAIANETAPFIHTFSIGEIPSFTVESQFAGLGTASYRRFLGSCINSMTLKFPVEGYVSLDLDIMSAEETVATSSMATAAQTIEYEHRPYDIFELAAAHVMVGTTIANAAAVAYIDSITDIVISNNLGGEGYVLGGAGTRKALPAGMVSVTGNIKVMFSDTSGANGVALVLDANNNTEKSILLTLIRGTSTLAAPTGVGVADAEAIQIIIPELTFAATSPTIEGPTGVYAELSFNGYYEDATVDGLTSGIQVKVVNSDAPRL